MSYSLFSPRFINLTAAISSGGAPIDLATGYLPFTSRFIVPTAILNVVSGTGLGLTAQYQLFTGFSGVGAVWGSAVTPLTLNNSSGVSVTGANQTNIMSAPYIVVRQMANAGLTGTLGIQLQVSLLP